MSNDYCTRCRKKIGFFDKAITTHRSIRLSNGKDTELFWYTEMKHNKCLTRVEQKEIEIAKQKRNKKKKYGNDNDNNDYIYSS